VASEFCCGWFRAANPEKVIEGDSAGCGGFGIEGIFGIDPCADRTLACTRCECGDGDAGAARGGGAGDLGDGADGDSAIEKEVDLSDACGDDITDCFWGGCEDGGIAVLECGLDLLSKCGRGRHGA
jgi:hypothetical protein